MVKALSVSRYEGYLPNEFVMYYTINFYSKKRGRKHVAAYETWVLGDVAEFGGELGNCGQGPYLRMYDKKMGQRCPRNFCTSSSSRCELSFTVSKEKKSISEASSEVWLSPRWVRNALNCGFLETHKISLWRVEKKKESIRKGLRKVSAS